MNNKTPSSNTTSGNRRNYFRVNQDVIFQCRPADTYEAHHGSSESAFEDPETVNLVEQLSRLDRDAAKNLRALAEKDRDLSEYLQHLSAKINLIAHHALLPRTSADSDHARRINLSEAGLAFESERAYYKGTFLAIRLIFLPSYVTFTGFAEVIRCECKIGSRAPDKHAAPAKTGEQKSGEVFQIAARFRRLSEFDRRTLSRQIIRAQSAETKNS